MDSEQIQAIATRTPYRYEWVAEAAQYLEAVNPSITPEEVEALAPIARRVWEMAGRPPMLGAR
jgi:hypothetical protein